MGIGKTSVAAALLLVRLSPNLAAAQAAKPAPAPAAPPAAASVPIPPPSLEALKQRMSETGESWVGGLCRPFHRGGTARSDGLL
jgi:hypothetical protein